MDYFPSEPVITAHSRVPAQGSLYKFLTILQQMRSYIGKLVRNVPVDKLL